jgi:phosphoribosylaminoimidazole-succinocarboxamide synthase
MMKLVHKGSTKDVYQSGEHLCFRFSDRYSVFDWGEMPDQITGKGEALARFAKFFYRSLESKSFRTHLVDLPCAENEMLVRPFEVVRQQPLPQQENIFIPLEVIFRLGVPAGSSLLKRAGFTENQRFSEPMIEFTTKLERLDRPLSHAEARELSGLTDAEWRELVGTATDLAFELEKMFAAKGITLWDGKFEFGAGIRKNGGREIVLVDTIGPDELRLTKDGVQLSKEVIRQFYRRDQWYQELEKAKDHFGEHFKQHLTPPRPLPQHFLKSVECMYRLLPEVMSTAPGAQEKLQRLLPELKEIR